MSLQLINLVKECFTPGMPGRIKNAVDTIMFHRIGPPCGTNAIEVATYFKTHPEALGVPWMPYHFVIPASGVVEQALPVLVQSPHGWKWNRRAIGVAVVGDFRRNKPGQSQVEACVWLTRRLNDYFNRPLRTEGHTAVPESTKTPGKVCPGRYFPYQSISKQALSMGDIEQLPIE